MSHSPSLLLSLLSLSTISSLLLDIVPAQGEISVGESKFFLCQVGGEAVPDEISWYFPNGEKIGPSQQRISVLRNDEHSSSLTIYNANVDDAGIYKCKAMTKDGSETEATVSLKIFQKLTFKKAPSPQEFKEGDDAVIICDIVSSPPPTVIWKHRGRDITLKKDDRFVVLTNNYLRIRGIKKTDEGVYRCEGRIMARGEIDFKDIHVVVNVPPSIRVREMEVNATADLNQSVTLTCNAEGYPEPEITWTKNLIPIKANGTKYRFSEDGSKLTILEIIQSDGGEYSCTAENKAGKEEKELSIKVFVKPKVTYVENKTAMELEDHITLTCEASGDPTPSIKWRTTNRIFTEGEQTLDGRIEVTGHARVSSITLKDVQYTDAGEYTCTAMNPIGQDSRSMFLEVQFLPELAPRKGIPQQRKYIYVTSPLISYPRFCLSYMPFREGPIKRKRSNPSVKIFSNLSVIKKMEVTPDSENDFGNYNCTASNRIGQDSREFILVQADTPSAPAIQEVNPYSSTAQVEFEEPDATGGVPVLKYLAEWRVSGEEEWVSKYYDAMDVSMNGIIRVVDLKPKTSYQVRLSAINGKGQGEHSAVAMFKTEPVREPSPPKLEGSLQESGNSFKVNWIKQDDGGSPIKHYLVKYKARHNTEWKPEMKLPADSQYAILGSLEWNVEYEVYVVAENLQGKSTPGYYTFKTSPEPTAVPADAASSSSLGTGAIVGILIVIFVILLVVVDVTCYFLNKCGLLMCIAVNLCGKSGPGAKGKDIEEGKAAFSKDESKEPIVEVRTEEERTPNHDGGSQPEPNETTPLTEPEHQADTTATVEDMLPSVTTVTTNSDTITETFATAQNSPTSETTTLTASVASTAPTAPESNSIPANQTTSPKAPAPPTTSPQPAPTSETAPKIAPLVDLSDTPATTAPAKNAVPSQGSVLSPSAPTSTVEASKAPTSSQPAAPSPANPISPPPAPEPKQPKQEAPSVKSPEKEAVQPSTGKSPTEAAKNPPSQKKEAASDSSTNPSQGEDFQMDGGTFKTSDIDLAKDVFAALGTAAIPTVASGQASGSAPAADTSVSPAAAKDEKAPLEEKSKPEETEAKLTPAEVKTVPNEATKTNENESKA
uniref:Neural cell adhesion molecule 1 n=1 Tax=Latimeria chalumnae TaxID=7897 RepID=H3BF90_LATCH